MAIASEAAVPFVIAGLSAVVLGVVELSFLGLTPGGLRRRYRKIRRLVECDLALSSKIRYVLDLAMETLLPRRDPAGTREYQIRGGTSVVLRRNTTDRKVFEEIFVEKAYAPHAKAIARNSPMILIDLGANIGLSAVALARVLQPVALVAVEPDRSNFAMLRENIRLAGLADQCAAVQAFAGVERGFAELVDSGNGAWGLRMGAPAQSGIPVLPLEEIIALGEGMASAAASPAARTILKCDIEGAEATLFHQLRQWEDRVHFIILELHTEFLSVQEFHACLAASRYRWRIGGTIPAEAVLAVIALERLELKAAVQSRHAARS
jgi:FkbM family methyltransferase